MPQKEPGSRRARAGISETTEYSKKRKIDTSGPIKKPTSLKAAGTMNMNFKHALGGMTRNVEMITAGKLVNEGRIFRTGELKRLADEQLEMQRKDKARGTKVSLLERKNVKGLRGSMDLDEMAEMVPSLKKHIDKERQQKEQGKSSSSGSGKGEDANGEGEAAPTLSGGRKARASEVATLQRALRGAMGEDGEDGEKDEHDDTDAAAEAKGGSGDTTAAPAAASSSSSGPGATSTFESFGSIRATKQQSRKRARELEESAAADDTAAADGGSATAGGAWKEGRSKAGATQAAKRSKMAAPAASGPRRTAAEEALLPLFAGATAGGEF